MPKADIAILTVIPEEYEAVLRCLMNFGCTVLHDFGSPTTPNQFGWVYGELRGAGAHVYRIVVGIVVQPGPGRMASAVSATVSRYEPQYILIVGIAGGFSQDGLSKGDVVIASIIYDYDYGKVATDFQPRMDFIYQTDQTLLTSAVSLHARDKSWSAYDKSMRPESDEASPKLFYGAVASGGKVIDNADNDFFAAVLNAWPRLIAVEMEGAGAAAAIETAKAAKQNVGFMMVRGISDMPRMGDENQPVATEGNKAERDKWKKYAASTAANFTIHWIANAWPLAPRPTPAILNIASGTPTLPSASTQAITVVNALTTNESAVKKLLSDQQQIIRDQFKSCSAQVLNWPTDLGHGEWITRPELRAIHDSILNSSHSTSLLLGSPGSGKSALLARLGQELQKNKVTVLAIKADLLSEDVKDTATLTSALGLNAPVGDFVRQLTVSEKVVILFDQLDALAALLDLHSGRLNVLLNLVRELDQIPNLHVVCSCREFEHRHDARLAAIDADVVQLSLPTWEQVATVLSGRGVPTEGWPPAFKELLRPPQHLKVFLQRLAAPTAQQVFASYQEMLDDLWTKRVTNAQGPTGRSELLMDIATAMANRESLWVPVALFEERMLLVENLIGVEILTRATEGAGIGFAHQTLFEHAWARAFARERCSLAEYTLDRQDGLFIRSTVWSGLTYIRGSDPNNFIKEFGKLWNQNKLRRHLRHLLIEFLGGISNPNVQEQAWLFDAMRNPNLEGSVLAAVRGNQAWFEVLTRRHLPMLMTNGTTNSGLLCGVLIAALQFGRRECLQLIRDNWLPHSAKDELTWHTVNYLPEWDVDAVDIACTVVARTPISTESVLHLVAQVVGASPLLAPRIVAVAFRRELAELEQEPDPEPPTLHPDATEEDRLVQKATFRAKDRFRGILEDRAWRGVEEIAEKATKEYLDHMWPLFCRTLGHLFIEPTGRVAQFRQDYCLGLEFTDDDEHRDYPFPASIDLAVTKLARDSPPDFLKLLEAEEGSDSETVQRLLARGLVELAGSHTDIVLRFLLGDERRFELGSHHDQHEDTIRLLQAIASHLSSEQFTQLETAIRNWSRERRSGSKHDANQRFRSRKYDRLHRLRLLASLPQERLSLDARRQLLQEQVAFPNHEVAGVSRIQDGFIGSPMSAKQMQMASNPEIVNLFRELPDTTESQHPRHWMRGGSSQASMEFEHFATESPDRAVAILAQFEPGKQERPAGAGLIGLSKSNFADDALFQLLYDLDARGFRSESFRIDAARAIEARLKKGHGLPDEACILIERWLAEFQQVPEAMRLKQDAKQEKPASVLWQRGGLYPLPYGTYHLLHALTFGYLFRKPPSKERWLAALEAHCERSEQTETWLALAWDLRHLNLCTPSHAVRFLSRLFERFPGVLEREEGAILLSNIWSFVPNDLLWKWLSCLRQGSWKKGAQAYGELLGLRALTKADDDRAMRELENELNRGVEPVGDSQAVRTGIAFACANLWDMPEKRQLATECLIRLIPDADHDIGSAILHVFIASDVLHPDEATHKLLNTLAMNPQVIALAQDGWFIERLEELLPNEAEDIYQLCREVVRLRGKEIGSIQTSWALHAAKITNIALTLHRMNAPYREKGLDLFEALLDIRLPDAEAALREIDLRPPGKDVRVMTRRANRHRRRQRSLA